MPLTVWSRRSAGVTNQAIPLGCKITPYIVFFIISLNIPCSLMLLHRCHLTSAAVPLQVSRVHLLNPLTCSFKLTLNAVSFLSPVNNDPTRFPPCLAADFTDGCHRARPV